MRALNELTVIREQLDLLDPSALAKEAEVLLKGLGFTQELLSRVGIFGLTPCSQTKTKFRELQKRTPKPKNRTNSAKELSQQFEGFTGHFPLKQGVLKQIAPESSPESSTKSLSQKFFGVPFSVPDKFRELQTRPNSHLPAREATPAFFDFLAFFVFRFPLLFLRVFPSFSKEFRGSPKRKTLAFFGVSLALLGLKGQGVQIRAPTPSTVSSKQEQTYTNSHSLVEDSPAEDLLAAGGANSGRFGAR